MVEKAYRYGIPGSKDIHYIIKDATKAIGSGADEFIRQVSELSRPFPAKMRHTIRTKLKSIGETAQDMIAFLSEHSEQIALLLIQGGYQLANGFLCGIINGIIEGIAGTLEFLNLLIRLSSAIYKMTEDVWESFIFLREMLENVVEALSGEQLKLFFRMLVRVPFTIANTLLDIDLKEVIKSAGGALSRLGPAKVGYFLGYAVGMIVEMLLEALLTGGVAAAAKAIRYIQEFVRGVVSVNRKTTSTLVKVADDAIVELASRMSAFFQSLRDGTAVDQLQKWIDNIIEEIRKALSLVDDVAEGAAHVKRGRYLGQALEEVDFLKVEKYLNSIKVDLQIGKEKGLIEVDGYFYPSGNPVNLKPHEAAMFITDGIKMKLVLRENATIYELLHELMHLRDCQRTGAKVFYSKPLVDREKFVYDKMVEHVKYLNREEIEHAVWYINDRYKRVGVTDNLGNSITEVLPFDLQLIPKKRQGINLDKILNLK